MLCYKKIISVFLVYLFFIISAGCAINDKRVILTFDDGPHPGITEKILEILDEHHVKATFFLVGMMINRHPYLVKKIHESGCEIGNHTYSDIRLTSLNKKDIEKSLNSVNDLLEATIGKRTVFFRPPGGRLNDPVVDVAHDQGYRTVLWTRHVDDTSRSSTVERIIKRATVNPGPTELIMMHSGPRETIEALPEIIRFYKSRGYAFTTVSRISTPMFRRIDTGGNRMTDWPMALWDADMPETDSKEQPPPKNVVGIITLFASIGSTVYFVRFSGRKKKNTYVSFVFLGAKKRYMKALFNILRENNVRGTFFLSENDIEEVLDLNSREIYRQEVAYLKDLLTEEIREDLLQWKKKLQDNKCQIAPFYYSADGYTCKDIEELKEEGFIPVDWKIVPPDKYLGSTHRFIKYIMKRLRNRSVIPIWCNSEKSVKALPDLIKEISSRGYSFLSLNDYLLGGI